MSLFRPTKSKTTGIGMRKDKGIPPKKMKAVSPKQRKRTDDLKEKLDVILKIQERLYGKTMCEASRGHENWKHRCPSLDKRYYKLVLDHVATRNIEDADKWENFQALCTWCNYNKGSIRGLDFRPPDMIIEMLKLDQKEKP